MAGVARDHGQVAGEGYRGYSEVGLGQVPFSVRLELGAQRAVDLGGVFVEGENCQRTADQVADLPAELLAVAASGAVEQLTHGYRRRELLRRRYLGETADERQRWIAANGGAEHIGVEAVHLAQPRSGAGRSMLMLRLA